MNAQKKKQQQHHNERAYDSSMKKPLICSVLLHIFVVVMGTVGLPYFSVKKEPVEMAITVEMAELDLVSQTDVLAPPKETKDPKKEPAPPKEEPKKNYSKPEPVPEEEPEPEIAQKQPDAEEIPEPPKPEEKKEEEKPEPKIPKPPKPINKPKPPVPKMVEKKKEPEKKKEEEPDINSLLTSLVSEDTSQPSPKTEEPAKTESSQTSQIARVTGKLTRSEQDDLNRGVEPCWNVNAGGKYAENLVVSLEVSINPDMSVSNVRVLDQIRYNSDTAFQAAADNARRALLNPMCSKLRLPPEKYNDWKVFTYNFDPSQML